MVGYLLLHKSGYPNVIALGAIKFLLMAVAFENRVFPLLMMGRKEGWGIGY